MRTCLWSAMLLVLMMLASVARAWDCIAQAVVSIDSESHDSKSGVLHLTFPETVSSWRAAVVFDSAVTQLQTWTATSLSRTPTKYVLKNRNYNGIQTAGDILQVSFQYYFDTETSPKIVGVRISGIQLCRPGVTIVPPTSTQASSSCTASGTVEEHSVWPTGMHADLVLIFSRSVTSWSARLTFSRAVTVLRMWDAEFHSSDSKTFYLTNKSYNAQVEANEQLRITFVAEFVRRVHVVSVLLDDEEQCVGTGSTAISSTSTTPLSSTLLSSTSSSVVTDSSTSTTDHQSDCYNSGYITELNSWDEGVHLSLSIPFHSHVNSWTVTMILNSPATELEVWDAEYSTEDNITYDLESKNYNSAQSAGNTLDLALIIRFRAAVSIESLALNGAMLCSNSSISTATATGSTTPATTITTGSTSSSTTGSTTPSTTITAGSTSSSTTITAGSTTGTTSTTFTPPTHQLPYNYSEVLEKSLLFYEAQRSGRLPASNRIPWRKDSALQDGADNGLSLEGGYYDAGDYVKFGFPMAAAFTLICWGAIDFADGYRAAGQTEFLEEAIRWATDYIVKCHSADFELYGQVGLGSLDHSSWSRPEDMTMSRPSFKISPSSPGSELAAETSATLSAASLVFNDTDFVYATELRRRAKLLYRLAEQHRHHYHDSITDAADFYKSWNGYGDELAWAALWLHKATGDQHYLNQAEQHYQTFSLNSEPREFSWDNKIAGVQLLLSRATGSSDYHDRVRAFCDWMLSQAGRTPMGLLFLHEWGSLRHAANAAFICLQAAEDGINPQQNRQLARQQIGYMLGDTGRSFVVGFGHNPPERPHHRSSSCPPAPSSCTWQQFNSPQPNPHVLFGALVGGPDNSDIYVDERSNYRSNEVALDYNAAFQGVVAGLLSVHLRGE